MEVNCLHSNNRKKSFKLHGRVRETNFIKGMFLKVFARNQMLVFGISSKTNTPSGVHALLLYMHESILRILLTENHSMYKSFGMLLYLNENSS